MLLATTLHWPETTGEWEIWIVLLLAGFVVLRHAAGWPAALVGGATAAASFTIDNQIHIPAAILLAGLMLLVTGRPARPLPAGVALREAAIVTLGFALYEVGRLLTAGEAGVATANSARVLDLERRLRSNIEPDLQRFVMGHELLASWVTRVYSMYYLPVVIGALIWFLVADRATYRVMRNALALSALLSLLTFWLYPVAPPRLLPEAGTVSLHVARGGSHSFVNEFAAVPSLHVGWTMLVSYLLFQTGRGRLRWLAWIPGGVMYLTVMATGHHYWFDGAIGTLYALAPAALLAGLPALSRWWARWMYPPPLPQRPSLFASVSGNQWALLDIVALAGLLASLLVGQLISPGFTDYWGYIVAQVAATILAVCWLSQRFWLEGGFSWLTHLVIVVVTYGDTFGTALGFYDRFHVYDKVTHFGGGAILAAVAYEIILALHRRGAVAWGVHRRMVVAVIISLACGSIWEIYELFGDTIFDTGRHNGATDTTYDLISDLAGAALTVTLLARLHPTLAPAPLPGTAHAGEPARHPALADAGD
jgi:hypothetical protein